MKLGPYPNFTGGAYNVPMPDEPGYSPDELKRMGLAGRGDLSWVARRFGGFSPFLRGLHPTWRGVLLTVLVAWVLSWLGFWLPWARHPIPGILAESFPPQKFGEIVSEMFADLLKRPLSHLVMPAQRPFEAGHSAMGPILALAAAVVLLRTAAGNVRRLWAGAVVAAAGIAAVGWVVIGHDSPWKPDTAMYLLNGVIALAGGTVAAFLLIRASGLARRGAPYSRLAPALAAVGLLLCNLNLLVTFPIEGFASLFGSQPDFMGGTKLPPWNLTLWEISWYTVPILGWALLPVPAFIILRGHGFWPSLRLHGRLAKRRTAVLALTYLGLALLALLPIGGILRAVLLSTGLLDIQPTPLPGSLLASLCNGVQTGIFLYATALAATALADLES